MSGAKTAAKITTLFYGKIGWTSQSIEETERQIAEVLAAHDTALAAAVREQCAKIAAWGDIDEVPLHPDVANASLDDVESLTRAQIYSTIMAVPDARPPDGGQANRRDERIRLEARLAELKEARALLMRCERDWGWRDVLHALNGRIKADAELKAKLKKIK